MLISHPSEEGFPEKPLFEHLQNVSHICRETIASQKLNLMQMNKMDLGKLSFLIGLFHDFGKATSWFQNYIRGHEKSSHFTNHSLFSAIVGYYAVLQEMKNEKWAYIAYMIIKRHHGNLESFEQCGDKLNLAPVKEQLKNIQKTCFDVLSEFYHRNGIELQFLSHIDWNDFKHRIDDSDEFVMELSEQNDDDSFETFFLINYLFSLLIDSDKQDAARLDNSYFCGNLAEEPSDVMAYVAFCRKNEPKKFAENIPINRYRNQFLNEIHNNPMITPKNHFYSITAPTGIGKTFGCLAFANTLKRQLPLTSGRIIYCLPYTSIIDQNYEEFEKIILFN
ncbi:MAG: CRISPR-associated endonuclease Cas3'', partial [Anaerolineales bacterium]|nr:CRISPR-associated endonuclease Cas3'' [Anaerolineales bacterium]